MTSEPRDGPQRDILFYVHGYFTSFDFACMRAAQLKRDIGFDGPIVVFSWASDNKLLSYLSDRAQIEASVERIARAMTDLARLTRVRRLNVLAHSLGTYGVVSALEQIYLRAAPLASRFTRPPESDAYDKLGPVVLAAPDIDPEVFRARLVGRLDFPGSWTTIYVSKNDEALKKSVVANKRPRLGLVETAYPIFSNDWIEIVDASHVGKGKSEHDYFASRPEMILELDGIFNKQARAFVRAEQNRRLLYAREGGAYYGLGVLSR